MKKKDLTIVVSIRNSMPYTRLFFQSLSQTLNLDEKTRMLIFDGGSADGSLDAIAGYNILQSQHTKILNVHELPRKQKLEIQKKLRDNNGLFTEWTWDFLLKNSYITSHYALFLHVDIYFKRKGLVDFLLNLVSEETNCILATQFDPGSFESYPIPRFDMPRFFPAISIVKVDPWKKGKFYWRRIRMFDRRRKFSILFDNGAQPFYRFYHKEIIGSYTYRIISENELDIYLEHLGYSWVPNALNTKNLGYFSSEAEKSRARTFEILNQLGDECDETG
jgi:hypothetical protein